MMRSYPLLLATLVVAIPLIGCDTGDLTTSSKMDKTVQLFEAVGYDFVRDAANASYYESSTGRTSFEDACQQNDGAWCNLLANTLEDGEKHKRLILRPPTNAGGSGFLKACYEGVKVPDAMYHPRFVATVGFVKGETHTDADGVNFMARLKNDQNEWFKIGGIRKKYNQRLAQFSGRLDKWGGETVTICLENYVGGNPIKDKGVWQQAKIGRDRGYDKLNLVERLDTAFPPKEPFFGVHFDFLWETYADKTGSKSADLALLVERIEELNVGSIRMPIRWNVTHTANNTLKEWNIADYIEVINALPEDVDIVAYLETPSSNSRHIFYDDPAAMGAAYADYVSDIVNIFKNRVKNWEVWNEPNNNHFCLGLSSEASPRKGNGDNCWTSGDFLYHIVKPAYDAIKEADSTATVVLGGMVFNGVVGDHSDDNQTDNKPYCSSAAHYVGPGTCSETWHIQSDFLRSIYADLAWFNWLESKPFDIVGTHPYFTNRFLGQQCVSPKTQTYGDNSTQTVMAENNDTATPIWWTETGVTIYSVEKEIEDHYPNMDKSSEEFDALVESEFGAYLYDYFTDAYNDTFEDPIRIQNPLQRIFWFTLRDWNTSKRKCPFGLLDCIDDSRREAFFAYKNVIEGYQKHTSIIDDFSYIRDGRRQLNSEIWKTDCFSYDGSCSIDHPNWGPEYYIRPGKDQWEESAIFTHNPVPMPGTEDTPMPMHLSFRFNTFPGGEKEETATAETYARISVGPTSSINGSEIDGVDNILMNQNGIHMTFQRHNNSHLAINLFSQNSTGAPKKQLIKWMRLCDDQSPNWGWMAKVDLKFAVDGSWRIEIRDSHGNRCFEREGTPQDNGHTADFEDAKIGLRLGSMRRNKDKIGFVKYDDIYLTNKLLSKPWDIDLEMNKSHPFIAPPSRGIAAHRGSRGHHNMTCAAGNDIKENTIAAIEQAIDLGAAMVEVDVMYDESDSEYVMAHDTAEIATAELFSTGLNTVPENIWVNVDVKGIKHGGTDAADWAKPLASMVLETGHDDHTTIVTQPSTDESTLGVAQGAIAAAKEYNDTNQTNKDVMTHRFVQLKGNPISDIEEKTIIQNYSSTGKIYQMLQYWDSLNNKDCSFHEDGTVNPNCEPPLLPTRKDNDLLHRYGISSIYSFSVNSHSERWKKLIRDFFSQDGDFLLADALYRTQLFMQKDSNFWKNGDFPTPVIALRPFPWGEPTNKTGWKNINLIQNPGAEDYYVDECTLPNTNYGDRVMKGWSDLYGTVTSETYEYHTNNAPVSPWQGEGERFFTGGYAPSSYLNGDFNPFIITQLIDLRDLQQQGQFDTAVNFELGGMFGGYLSQKEFVLLRATFLDGDGNELLTSVIGTSNPSDWSNERKMVSRVATDSIPANKNPHFLRIDLTFTIDLTIGLFANGTADDLYFQFTD